MVGVYILLCNNNRYYIGSTKRLIERLQEHESGRVVSTKQLQPTKLVFFQKYENITKARKAENWLKKQKSRVLVERIIKSGRIEKIV